MSKISTNTQQARDNSLDFKGFLNDLQGWDTNNKGKKSKPQDSLKPKSKVELVSEEKQPTSRRSSSHLSKTTSQYHPSMDYDPLSNIQSTLMTDESKVDAASEKDLGNEYFKQKKFNEAIDCYSRSIALSPTAVAYSNRAMAYLRIKRFAEAENDCTEALELDDRYVKAYSRRATARKELGKLRDSLDDVEFALRLEPQSEDLKKQRSEVKSLLEKAILAKASGTRKRPTQVVKEVEDNVTFTSQEKHATSVPDGSKKAGVQMIPDNKQVSMDGSVTDTVSRKTTSLSKSKQQVNGSRVTATSSSFEKNSKASQDLGESVEKLASRVAARSIAEAAKNISPPNSAYQLEVSWKAFSGDRSLQSRLLKVTPPEALPQIFKNALTAPLLIDIIKCLATLFTEETELVVKYLENLSKVPRFDMIILCLSSVDKSELCRIWNEVFLSKATPVESAVSLSDLHFRYCP